MSVLTNNPVPECTTARWQCFSLFLQTHTHAYTRVHVYAHVVQNRRLQLAVGALHLGPTLLVGSRQAEQLPVLPVDVEEGQGCEESGHEKIDDGKVDVWGRHRWMDSGAHCRSNGEQ